MRRSKKSRYDSVRKPFTTESAARLVAEITERMTGDKCKVLWEDSHRFVVIRNVSDVRMVRA